MNEFFTSTALTTFIVGVLSVAVTYMGLKRSKKVDEVTSKASNIDQVIAGLQGLAENYRGDNDELRTRIKNLEATLKETMAERDKLYKRVVFLENKYLPDATAA